VPYRINVPLTVIKEQIVAKHRVLNSRVAIAASF
jgi:hypothetical protein